MRIVFIVSALLLVSGCSSDDASSDDERTCIPGTVERCAGNGGPIDLRADTNRSGAIEFDDPSEDVAEDTWDEHHGAVFLANIDDDELACPKSGDDFTLPKCNDAADEVINGPDDLDDLAPLGVRAWPEAPDGARARLEVSASSQPFVRLFRKSGTAYLLFDAASSAFDVADLRAGVELRIEATDIVRDRTVWDGYTNITLVVTGPTSEELGRDTVRLRVSPVMTFHHLLPPDIFHVTRLEGSSLSQTFRDDLRAAQQAASSVVPLQELDLGDIWTQDFFEPAYMSMPGARGKQHVIRVYYRSANTREPAPVLRAAGQVVFTVFRGKDSAGVQAYDPTRPATLDDTLDSFGNTETIPPYTKDGKSYPLGRLLRGSTAAFHPDRVFASMLEAQAVQPPVYLDTSWLSVGHVDETLSFIRAEGPRGWALLLNDPALARTLFEEQESAGNGSVSVFLGQEEWSGSATRTISEILDDADVMAASQSAAIKIQDQLSVLVQETGVIEKEIVRVPFLHTRNSDGRSIAYQPATVNGLYVSDAHFAAPNPHGPVIDGKDIMKDQLESALGKRGVSVDWVEDWLLYHLSDGEVHCGTNTTRRVPETVKWWESGR